MDALTQMTVFAKVVEHSSFSEAARALGIAKSTASKHVTELERSLGVRLLHRTTRRLVLTESGRALYSKCAGLLAQAEEAMRAATETQQQPRGLLRVHAPASFGRLYLSPLLADFLARQPGVDLELLYVDHLVDIVRERIDVSVQLSQPADNTLTIRRLGTSRRFVCAAPGYLAKHGEPRTPEELETHSCLVLTHGGAPVPWRLKGPGGQISVKVSGRVRTSNSEALMALMLEGVGLGYPPAFAAMTSIREGRLVPVLPAWSDETLPIFLAYPPGQGQTPRVRAFLDFLIERLGQDAQWTPEVTPPSAAAPSGRAGNAARGSPRRRRRRGETPSPRG